MSLGMPTSGPASTIVPPSPPSPPVLLDPPVLAALVDDVEPPTPALLVVVPPVVPEAPVAGDEPPHAITTRPGIAIDRVPRKTARDRFMPKLLVRPQSMRRPPLQAAFDGAHAMEAR